MRFLRLPLRMAVVVWGTLGLIVLVRILVENTPYFVSAEYEGLWADVLDYHVENPDHLSLDELRETYGEEAAAKFAEEPLLGVAYLPSDEASVAITIAYSRAHAETRGSWFVTTLFMFVAILIPVACAIQSWLRLFMGRVCKSEKKQALYRAYFFPSLRSTLIGFGVTLPVVALLCFWNASEVSEASLAFAGLNHVSLTCALLAVAYCGGMLMHVVRSLVDCAFLALGVDPERTWLDGGIALLLTVPLLIWVYDNSMLSVAADAVAGIVPAFVMRRALA